MTRHGDDMINILTSRKNDQHQFSPNNFNTQYLIESALIFDQILSTSLSRKRIDISIENLYVDIGV